MGMASMRDPEEARRQVGLAAHKPDAIKIWVDDLFGQLPEMDPPIYAALIDEAHRRGIRLAHVFHLEDARKLVGLGRGILAHSVPRDADLLGDFAGRRCDIVFAAIALSPAA